MVSNFRTNFIIDSWEDREGEEIKVQKVYDHTVLNQTEYADSTYVLTPEETLSIKSAFNKFDKSKAGFVPIDCVPKIFVMAGQNPTKDMVQIMQDKLNKQGYGVAFYNDILAMFAKYWKTSEFQTKELRNALTYVFETTQADMDKMNTEELKKFVSAYGDVLDKEELKQFSETFVATNKKKQISATAFMKTLLEGNYNAEADLDNYYYKKTVTGRRKAVLSLRTQRTKAKLDPLDETKFTLPEKQVPEKPNQADLKEVSENPKKANPKEKAALSKKKSSVSLLRSSTKTAKNK